MKSVRRLSIAALVVACTHLVFGAIVRISGSGLGCGENWPKCYGYWFPPLSRPDLVIEVSHRYLASILTLTVLSLATAAWLARREPDVAGRGGPMRSAFGAVAAVFAAALLGGLTVKEGNAWWATVAHWLVAMTLLALVTATAIRAGMLGGKSAAVQHGTQRARRSARAAAGLAIFAVALGGVTAKIPDGAIGCSTVPMCAPAAGVSRTATYVQMTHRAAAVLLVLHLFGMVMMVRKRRSEEAPIVVRATYIAFGMVILQLVVASSMILLHLPPVLRSLHEATGVGIWLACFALAYLAHRVAGHPEPAVVIPSDRTVVIPSDPTVVIPSEVEESGLVAERGPTSPDPSTPSLRSVARDDTKGESLRSVARDDTRGESLRSVARDDTVETKPKPAPTMAVIVARGADL